MNKKYDAPYVLKVGTIGEVVLGAKLEPEDDEPGISLPAGTILDRD